MIDEMIKSCFYIDVYNNINNNLMIFKITAVLGDIFL